MRILKKILKYLSWLIILLIIFLIGLYFFIQTETFNKWALEFTLSKLNKSWELKDNKVNAESLNGNILSGIKLNNGSILVKGDTLAAFSSLEVKYDLWALLKHKITVEYLDLNNPRINLIGQKNEKDSTIWNFQNLLSPSTQPDTSKSKFDWNVAVNTFKIENGFLRVVGNRQGKTPVWEIARPKEKEFDFNNLDISNLNIESEARYYTDSKNINLKNLSFNTNSDVNLKKLAIDATVNEKDTVSDIHSMELVTDRSNIKIDEIHIAGVDPIDTIITGDFKNKEIKAKINIALLNFADLRFFIPSLDMLDSTISLFMDINGKYNDLNINDLTLKLPNSNINLKGKVKNADNPDSTYYDITANNLQLSPKDISLIYKGKSVPDYSNLGTILANLYFKGTANNFYSEYDIKSDAGYVNGKTSLDLNNEIYDGNVTTHQLNLGKILKSNKLNSNINLDAKYFGNGFAMNKMSADLTYSMTGSSMAGYNVSSSIGQIKASRGNFNVNIKAVSSAGNMAVAGKINLANTKNPIYILKGNVKGLDISKFTKKGDDKSNLNLAFDINGRGSGLNNINGKFDFMIDRSSYSNYKLSQTPLNIDIVNSNGNGRIRVVTDMAEFNADGSFNISALSNAVQYNIAGLSSAIKHKLNQDSGFVTGISPVKNINSGNVSLSYSLVIKDTAKFNEVMQPFGIFFNGDVRGNVINSPAGFNSTVSVNIKDFQYKDTVIVLKNVNSGISFKNDYSSSDVNSLSPYNISVNSTGDRMIFSGTQIDSARISLNMANSIAQLNASARQDTTMRGRIAGNFDLSQDKIIANIDTMNAKYKLYEVVNNNTWAVKYNPGQEINFEQFGIRSKNMVMNVTGNYSFNGNSDITAESDNIPLNDLYSVINPPDTTVITKKEPYPIEGNITRLYVNYKGTFDNPEITADVSTNTLKYKNDNIGTLTANINYKDEVLKPNIVFANYNSKGSLKISGNVPYKNPLGTQDTTQVITVDGPVGLILTAQDFQIGYFAKLVPGLGNIRGVLKGELTANGTASNPDLKGNMALTNGSYLLSLTGMEYGFNFNMSTANSKLVLDKFSMYNPDDDSKHFDIFGNIDFTGMKLNNVDLTASGDMVFLDESVEENDLGVYGYFYGGSGTPPITIKGNLEKMDVNGQFLVKEATISSIPMKGSGYDVSDNFKYINAKDTVIHLDSVIIVTPEELAKINPFEKRKYRLAEKETSVMDFLNIDVNVKTAQNIFLSIDFNNITKDRLFGEIQADLNIKTENRSLNAYGDVNVVGNSYYRFYRDFKIKDTKITFNGPIGNPKLNVKAVYEGTKQTEQFGTTSNVPVQVQLTVRGMVDDPQIALKLIENGTEVTGSDAQTDAITYLLFGRYQSELSTSQTQAMASSVGSQVGSMYASSYISQALRQVLPFIVDAEFHYNEGDVVQNTDVAVTSQFGDATVKVGSREIKDANYFEFTVDYPVNKMLNLNLPETLLLEIAKEELTNSVITSSDVHYSTGIKLIYKFKF